VDVSAHRRDDWNYAYHVRPFVVELGDRRQTISALEAQLLLGELARLPKARHQAAEDTACGIVHGLASGCALGLDEDERRVVLRAIEGVRARRSLPSGLTSLRGLLLRADQPVI
jgi:hypothetical protein